MALVCSLPLLCQVITGKILGTVTDSSGKLIPGVAVTVTNQQTGIAFHRVTDATGDYSVEQLPVGNYQVTASATGFQTSVTSGIAVSIGASVRVDSQLTVGSVNETVQVQAGGIELQTAGSEVSATIGQQLIDNLPVSGRDPLNLVLLSPTVVQRGTLSVSVVDEPYLGTNIPTTSGGRGEAVDFTVGGLNINNRMFNTPMEKPPLDSLA
jgi:hypothetical protein